MPSRLLRVASIYETEQPSKMVLSERQHELARARSHEGLECVKGRFGWSFGCDRRVAVENFANTAHDHQWDSFQLFREMI